MKQSLRLTDSYQGLYKESGGETKCIRYTDSYQGLYKESGGRNKHYLHFFLKSLSVHRSEYDFCASLLMTSRLTILVCFASELRFRGYKSNNELYLSTGFQGTTLFNSVYSVATIK